MTRPTDIELAKTRGVSLAAQPYWQSIRTTYSEPTERTAAKVLARCEAAIITVPWDPALGKYENHAMAAWALMQRLGWDETRDIVGGSDGAGFVFVLVDRAEPGSVMSMASPQVPISRTTTAAGVTTPRTATR